jgi:hypothetical protein
MAKEVVEEANNKNVQKNKENRGVLKKFSKNL